MKETWKPVVGYEKYYEISSTGRLMRLPIEAKGRSGCIRITSSKILKRVTGRTEYLTYQISKFGKRKNLKAHRLVAAAFIPNPEKKPYVNHKDGNKLNNSILNLEWVTAKENVRHAWDNSLNKMYPHQIAAFRNQSEKNKGSVPPNAKIILDNNTGVFYYSTKDASNFVGIKSTTLLAQLNGTNRNKTSLILV